MEGEGEKPPHIYKATDVGCKVGVEGDKGAYKIATYKTLLSSVINEQILWCIYLLWLIMLSLRFFSLDE